MPTYLSSFLLRRARMPDRRSIYHSLFLNRTRVYLISFVPPTVVRTWPTDKLWTSSVTDNLLAQEYISLKIQTVQRTCIYSLPSCLTVTLRQLLWPNHHCGFFRWKGKRWLQVNILFRLLRLELNECTLKQKSSYKFISHIKSHCKQRRNITGK